MISAFSVSEAGGHPVNEDTFVVQQHPSDSSCWICTLADGQGGQAGGGHASQLACQKMMELLGEQPPSRLMEIRVWQAVFRKTDEAVAEDKIAGFTTLIGFCVKGDKIVGGSNGDSAVIVCDKTRVAEELTKNPMKNPPVGSGVAAFVPFATELQDSWRVMAMSDGVWKYVGWYRFPDLCAQYRGQELIAMLQQCARLPGSGKFQDDFTLALLQNDPDNA